MAATLPAFSLVIPAYNEAHRIGQTVTEVLRYLHATSPESELIVVDDGSTDGTWNVVQEMVRHAEHAVVRVVRQPTNRGRARIYILICAGAVVGTLSAPPLGRHPS